MLDGGPTEFGAAIQTLVARTYGRTYASIARSLGISRATMRNIVAKPYRVIGRRLVERLAIELGAERHGFDLVALWQALPPSRFVVDRKTYARDVVVEQIASWLEREVFGGDDIAKRIRRGEWAAPTTNPHL